mmetsp:Transcript_27938/g.90084  ORF Transcript_27938/g.90084 Transcript_27938/m.90084 type:complete len:205 (+) Transcript_27938:156-770(+)
MATLEASTAFLRFAPRDATRFEGRADRRPASATTSVRSCFARTGLPLARATDPWRWRTRANARGAVDAGEEDAAFKAAIASFAYASASSERPSLDVDVDSSTRARAKVDAKLPLPWFWPNLWCCLLKRRTLASFAAAVSVSGARDASRAIDRLFHAANRRSSSPSPSAGRTSRSRRRTVAQAPYSSRRIARSAHRSHAVATSDA